MKQSSVYRVIYERLKAEGFKYFLSDGNLYDWNSSIVAINDKMESWELTICTSRSDFEKYLMSKQHKMKKCRHLSPVRLPVFSSLVCTFNLIQPVEIPDYSGLFYVMGAERMNVFDATKKIKHPERLTDELVTDTEMLWIFEQSQKQYIKLLWH